MAAPKSVPRLVYYQSTGVMLLDSIRVGIGYAGKGVCKNSPADEAKANWGPIPRGLYAVEPAFTHPSLGPVSMRLLAYNHNALGRSGFLIHGDNLKTLGDSSHGCIILPRASRQIIAALSNVRLEVVR